MLSGSSLARSRRSSDVGCSAAGGRIDSSAAGAPMAGALGLLTLVLWDDFGSLTRLPPATIVVVQCDDPSFGGVDLDNLTDYIAGRVEADSVEIAGRQIAIRIPFNHWP